MRIFHTCYCPGARNLRIRSIRKHARGTHERRATNTHNQCLGEAPHAGLVPLELQGRLVLQPRHPHMHCLSRGHLQRQSIDIQSDIVHRLPNRNILIFNSSYPMQDLRHLEFRADLLVPHMQNLQQQDWEVHSVPDVVVLQHSPILLHVHRRHISHIKDNAHGVRPPALLHRVLLRIVSHWHYLESGGGLHHM